MPNEEQSGANQELKLIELKQLILDAENREAGRFHPRFMEFVEEIQKKYPEEIYKRCKLWHFLVGSSPDETIVVDFDTPGGEIENFIRNELPSLDP